MSYLTIILIALGLSMDSLAVSISRGICMKGFCIRESLKIASVLGIFQGGLTFIGWALGSRFSTYIQNFDHWIAFILLSYLGGKMIYESLKKKTDKTEVASPTLSLKMICTLAFATSIDAFAVGIGFAVMKVAIFVPFIIITATTFILSMGGVCCGSWFSNSKKINVEFFGGAILFAIGLKILLEHTIA